MGGFRGRGRELSRASQKRRPCSARSAPRRLRRPPCSDPTRPSGVRTQSLRRPPCTCTGWRPPYPEAASGRPCWPLQRNGPLAPGPLREASATGCCLARTATVSACPQGKLRTAAGWRLPSRDWEGINLTVGSRSSRHRQVTRSSGIGCSWGQLRKAPTGPFSSYLTTIQARLRVPLLGVPLDGRPASPRLRRARSCAAPRPGLR